jgi:hypothetical protein
MRLFQNDNDRLGYPFTLDGFGEFGKQKTGLKEFDFNVDGLAPDLQRRRPMNEEGDCVQSHV